MALLTDAYDGLSVFYENSTTVIYKGTRKEDGLAVMLKTYKNPDETFRVKHEFDLLHGKDIAGAGRVLEVSYNDDKTYLVREDTGAIVLDDYLANVRLSTSTFLKLAKNAAEALQSIHEAGIVHCDIKPANLLVHPGNMTVTFIDFGISFATHQRASQQKEGFAGTLEFMAPEQTGRLNMTVDVRSDLYSLGITLYYLLTGELPFKGDSAVELIHAQTVLPAPPMNQFAQVDPILDAIVMKLLEKAPKKRYQSAESLAYDLNRCIDGLGRDSKVTPFSLGEKDVFALLEPDQRLFGKETDMEELTRVFFGVNKDTHGLILLHGPEGSGKSRLLDEFMHMAEDNNGYLLYGRFDWKNTNKTHSALRDMFEGFDLFAYNANLPLPEYREQLLEELGENAGALIDVIPSFETILGSQPEPMKLNPVEAAERARLVVRQMLKVLGEAAPYPYVLVFDDCQWADEPSLDLLLSAIESLEVKNCLMLLCYDDDDAAFLHRFGERLRVLDKDLSVTDIVSKHLDAEQIAKLMEHMFDAGEMDARGLGEILYEASGGEMDKLRTLLQTMYRGGQITYDAAEDEWGIHFDAIDESVLRDIENRYKAEFDTLSDGDKRLLAKLACVGERFDAADAAQALELEKNALDTDLKRLAVAGWVVQGKHGENDWGFGQKTMYELCYAYQKEENRIATHVQVVEKLYPVYQNDGAAMLAHADLFTRQVNATGRSHYNADVLHDIARYQLTVALQYMQAANMAQAVKEFASGLRLLGKAPFEADYTLAYELFLQYSLCCFALRQDNKAEKLLQTVLKSAQGEDDIYNAYFKTVEQYLARAEWEKAKEYARRYLEYAGQLLPEGEDAAEAGEKEYQRYLQLSGDDIGVSMQFTPTRDRILDHHGNMLIMYAEALSFSLDRNCRYYLYKAINMAVEAGEEFSQFIKIFPVAAARYASMKEFKKAKYLIDAGLAYAEKTGREQAFLWCVYGNMISHWVNPLKEVEDIYKHAKYHAMLEGNAFYEAYADLMLLNYKSFLGEELEEFHADTMATLHNLERTGMQALQANFVTLRQYARCLMGRTAGSDSFDDASFFEAQTLKALKGSWYGTFNEAFFYVYRMKACYIHLHFEKAVEYAKKYEEFNKTTNMTAYLTHVQYFYYYSMALLELCRMHPENKDEYVAQIQENQKEQQRFADLNPTNFEFKNMLVNVGLEGLEHQNIELVQKFSECHSGFMGKGLIWDAIFVERLIGNFWIARGIPQYEIIHKNNRMVHYKDIGARVCVRLLGQTDEASLMRKREAREREEMLAAARAAGHLSTGYGSLNSMSAMATMATMGTWATMGTMGTMGSWASNGGFNSTSIAPNKARPKGLNAALDFEALLGVLERLIGIDKMHLLTKELARLLLQNGNAEKVLVFLAEGQLVHLNAVEYAVEGSGGFIDSELPLDFDTIEADRVPKKLVGLVMEKDQPIIANSARNEWRMLGDRYINDRKPESMLCLPITVNGQVLGAIYLENASLPGAFPEGRAEFLQALVQQASALVLNLMNAAKLADYTKDLEKRLSSYLAQQNALIAGIAHEINSPVGVCLTVATKIHEKTLQVLQAFEEKKLGMKALYKYLEESRDGLDIINNNIMRAGDLVQNFKKMSVEQSTEVFEMLDLAPTLRNIVEYIRPGVKKKIDSIDIEIDEDLRVYTCSGVLAQVFTNLIMNSAIHGFEDMPKEGCHAKIVVTDYPKSDEIEIRYSDDGRGMDAEEQEKVFQPFFTTKRNRGGSGLGGHIILTCITQTLRGSVVCESEPGKGTTYIMRLPKSAPQTQEG